MFRFENWPLLLLLIPTILLGYLMFIRFRTPREGIAYPSFLASLVPVTPAERVQRIVRWFPLVALVLMVVAIARPQLGKMYERQHNLGIDIILCLDVSSSMKAMDFKPNNRFEVAKQTSLDFLYGRPHDRLGFVPFAAYAITRCPLTTDREILNQLIAGTQLDSIEDGTAIGMAIATAVNRLRKSEAKSKVVILLTDGVNNRGNIDPRSAAELAKAMGVRIYAIGVGTRGLADMPRPGPFGTTTYVQVPVEIDEEMLQEVTADTGGAYFRATDPEKLASIFEIIDRLEKTRIEVKQFALWRDMYLWPLLVALALLCIFVLMRDIWWRTKA